MSHTPAISIVLPVYNAEKYIAESLRSVLNQSFSDFELIILNDGSKDKSGEVIQSFKDDRIVYVEQANIGLAATLNRGIGMARAELIARQDNDDVCLPERLEKQFNFLKNNPDVVLVGTWAEIIDENGNKHGRYLDHPTDKHELKFALLFNNPFVHSSVMFRKDVLKRSGDYYTGKDVFEDHNLWSRISRYGSVANLPERLLLYREVNSSMSRTTSDYRNRVKLQTIENVAYYCKKYSKEKITEFVDYILGEKDAGNYEEALSLVEDVMNEISSNFAKEEKIDKSAFAHEAGKQVFNFRHFYLNRIIYNDKAGIFKKIKAKISRRILFSTHKAYLR